MRVDARNFSPMPIPHTMRFDPAKVIARRLELGMTQGQAAGRAKLSQSMLCDIEAGRRNGSPNTQQRLARALKVRAVADLYFDAETPPPQRAAS